MEIKVVAVARICEMSARSIEALSYDDVFVGYAGISVERAQETFEKYLFKGPFKNESQLTKEFALKGLVYIYAREHKKRGDNE